MTTLVQLRVTEIRSTSTAKRTFVVAVELAAGQRFEHSPYVHPTVRPPVPASEPRR